VAAQPHDDLDARDYQALAAFRRALRGFTAFSEQAAREAGFTPQQHQAILAIKGQAGGGPCAVGDLAEALGLRHHSAVELANRLVEAGLVDRIAASDDRRKVMLQLTPKAETILGQLSVLHLAELRQRGPALIDLLQTIVRP
jgi:DNA-binding MarR family transcriptional regulator